MVLFAIGIGVAAALSRFGSGPEPPPEVSKVDPNLKLIAGVEGDIADLRRSINAEETRVEGLEEDENELTEWFVRRIGSAPLRSSKHGGTPAAAPPSRRSDSGDARRGGGVDVDLSYRPSPHQSGYPVTRVVSPPLADGSPETAAKLKALQDEKLELELRLSRLRAEAERLRASVDDLQSQKVIFEDFRQADLVFVQEGAQAVAVGASDSDAMTVLSVAEYPVSKSVRLQAERGKQKLVEADGRLVRDLVAAGPGPLRRDLSDRLRERYWKAPRYIPAEASDVLVSFIDLRDPEGRVRLGYELEPATSSSIRLATIKDRNETLQRDWVRPSRCLRAKGKDILDRSPGANFLDYALLRVAQKISSDDPAVYHRVRIDVKVDVPRLFLQRLIAYRPSRYTNWSLWFLRETVWSLPEVREELAARNRMQTIRKALEDEIYSRMDKLGIPTVERENLGAVLQEQELAGKATVPRGRSLRRVEEELAIADVLGEPKPIQASRSSIKPASHALLVEIAPGPSDTELRMTARLTLTDTSDTLFADDDTYSLYNPAEPTDHMLASGRLIKINAVRSSAGAKQVPLRGRIVSGRKPDSILAVLEQGKRGGPLLVRDPFSIDLVALRPELYDSDATGVVKTWADAPANNRMRFLAYQVARAVKPQAGLVTQVERAAGMSTVQVSFTNANRRFKAGMQLAAGRPARTDAYGGDAWLEELPVDLTVRNVTRRGLRCLLETSGANMVWAGDTQLKKGDLVYPRRGVQPLLTVEDPKYTAPTAADFKRLGLDVAYAKRDGLAAKAVEMGEIVAAQVRTSLRELGVEVMSGDAVADAAGNDATHRVRGTMGVKSSKSFRLDFEVLPVGSNKPIATFNERLFERDMVGWRPDAGGDDEF